MAKLQKKSPKLSLKRVRILSPSTRSKPDSDSIEGEQRVEFLDGRNSLTSSYDGERENTETATERDKSGNKVMVVVDNGIASKNALEWALSHTVQTQDTVFLLYVAKPPKKGRKKDGKHILRANQLLHSMKNVCQSRRPGVVVELRVVEGEDKGPTIVEEARRAEVSLLVVGQEKQTPRIWRLFRHCLPLRRRDSLADYCVQNAASMTVAVRRKSSKLGGYLITTKRHKNFWLLA